MFTFNIVIQPFGSAGAERVCRSARSADCTRTPASPSPSHRFHACLTSECARNTWAHTHTRARREKRARERLCLSGRAWAPASLYLSQNSTAALKRDDGGTEGKAEKRKISSIGRSPVFLGFFLPTWQNGARFSSNLLAGIHTDGRQLLQLFIHLPLHLFPFFSFHYTCKKTLVF